MPNANSRIQCLLEELLKNTCTLNIKETARVIYMEDPSLTQTLPLLKVSDRTPEIHWDILTTLKDTVLEHQKPESKQIPPALAKALYELGIHLLLEDEGSPAFRETIAFKLKSLILKFKMTFLMSELALTEEDKGKLKEMSIGDASDTKQFVQEQIIKQATQQAIEQYRRMMISPS